MNRSTAWVLLLCTGIPTPALWRRTDKSAGARQTGSGRTPAQTVRVVVRPAAPRQPAVSPGQPTRQGWLSDDPELAEWVAEVVAEPTSAPATTAPPPPSGRRQAAPKATRQPAKTAAPVSARPARQPRTRAEKRAAETSSWPGSWGALADGWDDHR